MGSSKNETSGTPPGPSRKRLRLYKALAATVVPVAILAGIEGTLRIAGAGYPTSFFLEDKDSGIVKQNDQFSWRFFPRQISRDPLDLRFEHPKPDDIVRIFILGESAAQGDPMPDFSFSRCLEILLEDCFPGRRVEIINTGVTAISSHVIREIAKDCQRYEPDLAIAYIGNNEVVGPYGPGTTLTPLLESGPAIRLHVALKTTKTAQVLESIIHASGGSKGPERWMGMEHFTGKEIRARDPRMERTYDLFEKNLHTIIGEFTDHKVPVILCTIATNLQDCAPFSSANREDITVPELTEWNKAYERGVALEEEGRFMDALSAYEDAIEIDDTHAESRWRIGRCLEHLSRVEESLEQYIAARDLDTLRFRADSRINEIVCELGKSSDEIMLLDINQRFLDTAEDGLPGDDLLYEHVHMNFTGQYVIARALAPEVAQVLGGEVPTEWPHENDCARELGFTLQAEKRIARKILGRMSRAPFTAQAQHNRTLAELRQTINELTPRMTLDELKDVLERRPNDMRVLMSYAILLAEEGDCTEAVPLFQRVIDIKPESGAAHDSLGRCLFQLSRFDEAEAAFRTALELDDSLDNTGLNLSLVVLSQDRLQEARELFLEWAPRGGELTSAGTQLARVLTDNGDASAAHEVLTEVLRLQPGRAVFLAMGDLETHRGNFQKAGKWFDEVLQRVPEDSEALCGLGRIAEESGNNEEAMALYRRAISRRPDMIEARVGLSRLSARSAESEQ